MKLGVEAAVAVDGVVEHKQDVKGARLVLGAAAIGNRCIGYQRRGWWNSGFWGVGCRLSGIGYLLWRGGGPGDGLGRGLADEVTDVAVPLCLENPMVSFDGLVPGLPVAHLPGGTLYMLEPHVGDAMAGFFEVPAQAEAEINVLQTVLVFLTVAVKSVEVDFAAEEEGGSHGGLGVIGYWLSGIG